MRNHLGMNRPVIPDTSRPILVDHIEHVVLFIEFLFRLPLAGCFRLEQTDAGC